MKYLTHITVLSTVSSVLAGQWCLQQGPILCVTGIDKGNYVDLTLEIDPTVGWFAFGTGDLKNADMIVGWLVNSTDKVNPSTKTPMLVPVVSNRHWNGQLEPEIDTDPNSALIEIYPDSGLVMAGNIVTAKNPITGKLEEQEIVEDRYILHLQRAKKDNSAQDLEWKAGATQYVWALNSDSKVNPRTTQQDAPLMEPDLKGVITMSLFESNSLSQNTGVTSFSSRKSAITAHAWLMMFSFCIFLPLTLATALVNVWSPVTFEKPEYPSTPTWTENLRNKKLFWAMLGLTGITSLAGIISGAIGTTYAGWATFHSIAGIILFLAVLAFTTVAILLHLSPANLQSKFNTLNKSLKGLLGVSFVLGLAVGATGLADFAYVYGMTGTVIAAIIFYSIWNLGVVIFESLVLKNNVSLPKPLKAHASDVALPDIPMEKGMSKSSSLASVTSTNSLASDDTFTNKKQNTLTTRILGYETDQTGLINSKAGFVKLEDD